VKASGLDRPRLEPRWDEPGETFERWRAGQTGFPFVSAAMRELAATRVVVVPAQNEGNWQWVAGTGIDAQPWFRILNPERQRERFDPDLAYCRAWEGEGYPEPMLDLEIEAAEAKERFRAATL